MVVGRFFLFFVLIQSSLFAGERVDYQTRVMADVCFTCHTTEKISRSCFGFPPIAGAKKEYLKKRMRAFRGEKVFSVDMHRYAKGYSDKEIELLADYISRVGE